MKKWIALLAAPLFALVSCSSEPVKTTDSDTKYIGVKVDAGVPKVSDEPALADKGRNKITWQLDESAWLAGYFFRSDGITPGSDTKTPPMSCKVEKFKDAFERCDTKKAGRELTCHRINGVFVPGACYAYAVTLWKNGKIVLDPWIKNE